MVKKIIGICAESASPSGNLEGFRNTTGGFLVTSLENAGYTVCDYWESDVTHFVSLDYNKAAVKQVQEKVPVERRVLIIQEPSVVSPSNYSAKARRKFGSVISLTPEASDDFLPWPQADLQSVSVPLSQKRRSGSVVLVNANKVSFLPGSQYGLRRKVLKQAVSSGFDVHLAGSGWEKSIDELVKQNLIGILFALKNRVWPLLSEWGWRPRQALNLTHHGIVNDKYQLMQEMDFAIVIENSATYVSEKLFDAILSGCVPLYCGPNLKNFEIPEDVAIQLPPNPSDFTFVIKNIDEDQKQKIRLAGAEWLNQTETIHRWSEKYALNRIAQKIGETFLTEDEF